MLSTNLCESFIVQFFKFSSTDPPFFLVQPERRQISIQNLGLLASIQNSELLVGLASPFLRTSFLQCVKYLCYFLIRMCSETVYLIFKCTLSIFSNTLYIPINKCQFQNNIKPIKMTIHSHPHPTTIPTLCLSPNYPPPLLLSPLFFVFLHFPPIIQLIPYISNKQIQKSIFSLPRRRGNMLIYSVLRMKSERIIFFIDMNVRYRIQSFSSQNQSFPISNLLSKHSAWQSQRFCDYPQQITISFYQPMLIHSIKIAAHSTKIPSRINILYHLPEHQDQGFIKYGFITFSEGTPDALNAVQVKELGNANIKVLEMRFLILRNHMNKHNFFNQVALSSLSFIATPIQHLIPSPIPNKSALLTFDTQISIFNQLKNSFVKREQFEQAKQIKQVLNLIDRANIKMNQMEAQKQKLVKEEDFMGAKRLKESMFQYKNQVTNLVNNFYDPQKKLLKTVKSDEKIRKKVEQLNLLKNSSTFSQGTQPKTPRASRLKDQPQILKQQNETVSEGQQLQDRNESIVSHDDRVLPAIMSRIKGMNKTQIIPQSSQIGDNQFFQSSDKVPNLPAQPEAMSPADQANSSLLLEFYEPGLIRKLHSKYWQFRLEAVQKVVEELKQNQNSSFLSKNRLRCYLFIYSLSVKSHNFQISNASLQLMNILAPMKPQGQYKTQLHNQLENAFKNTLKKLNQSNQKIKLTSQKTVLRIIQSGIFGVNLCYSCLIKSYNEKVSAKIRKIKIEDIEYMVQKYGIGENGVPFSVVQFALKAANDQDSDVRKSAINLAKTIKQKGGKQRLESLLMETSGVKQSIAKKLSH